jgi:hypothetical protein
MRKVRFRDAIREAMSEEMRRDQTVFLMGEEVAEYNGQIRNRKLTNIQEATIDKDLIVPQNNTENKWIQVADRYLKMLSSDKPYLEESDYILLYEVATLCPYTAGPAVYQARTILNAMDMGVWVNDEEICQGMAFKNESQDPLRQLQNQDWQKQEVSFSLFPNPAKERITLMYLVGNNQNLTLEITNLLGQAVEKNISLSDWGAEELNVSELRGGVYFIKLFQSGQLIDTKKIVIE